MIPTPETTPADPSAELKVTDLGMAALLTARGQPILRLEGRLGRRVFVFPPEARSACQAYVDDAPIGSRSYAEAVRRLKALIHTAGLLA